MSARIRSASISVRRAAGIPGLAKRAMLNRRADGIWQRLRQRLKTSLQNSGGSPAAPHCRSPVAQAVAQPGSGPGLGRRRPVIEQLCLTPG